MIGITKYPIISSLIRENKVETPEGGNRDRDTQQERYQEQEQKNPEDELPKEKKELIDFLENKIDEYQSIPAIKDQQMIYSIEEHDDDIKVKVATTRGEVIHLIAPKDFLTLCRNHISKGSSSKGTIVDTSV